VLEEGVLGLNPERLPSLLQIGNKLQGSWLDKVFAGDSRTRVRPWLKARMPGFRNHGKLLTQGLMHQAGLKDDESEPRIHLEKSMVETGLKLTQQNSGLDCRQCHGIGDQPPRGDEKTQIVLGVNFSVVSERLRREYYDRWMRDPLRIDPQTKMPKYAVDGKKTKILEILDGNAHQQFEALWQYLNAVKQ